MFCKLFENHSFISQMKPRNYIKEVQQKHLIFIWGSSESPNSHKPQYNKMYKVIVFLSFYLLSILYSIYFLLFVCMNCAEKNICLDKSWFHHKIGSFNKSV